MPSSLLPERPLLVSPTLASTIGLEEAVMLQGLADLIEHRTTEERPAAQELEWIRLSEDVMLKVFPFWEAIDVRRVQNSLLSLGLIAVDPGSGDDYYVAVNDATAAGKSVRSTQEGPRATAPGTASLIPANWQPDDNWVRFCKQQAIPEQFIHNLVPEFVSYWRERGQARFSLGNAFYKHVLKEWRNEQTRRGAHELASTMSADWRPSADATDILENAGINGSFIEDAIPEFVLYWRERGEVHGAWNTRFINHIRKQWARFSASFGTDDTPRPIAENWQPSAECYEILQLAEIDEDYARSRVPEFVMYWRDRRQVKSSWNTVFLQYIKQNWAHKLKQLESADVAYAENQSLAGSSQQRIRERFRRIADRSWAE